MEYQWSVMATDALLALACLVLAGRVNRVADTDAEAPHLVAGAFIIWGSAALVGGFRHGLGPLLSPSDLPLFWYSSYVLIMLGNALLLWGFLRAMVADEDVRQMWYPICFVLKFLMLTLFFLISGETRVVAFDGAVSIGMLAVAAAGTWRHPFLAPSARWLVAGAAVSVVAGLLQIGLVVHTGGTLHDDLFHLIQIPAVYSFHRAALGLRDGL